MEEGGGMRERGKGERGTYRSTRSPRSFSILTVVGSWSGWLWWFAFA
jgi:hypothetical protein